MRGVNEIWVNNTQVLGRNVAGDGQERHAITCREMARLPPGAGEAEVKAAAEQVTATWNLAQRDHILARLVNRDGTTSLVLMSADELAGGDGRFVGTPGDRIQVDGRAGVIVAVSDVPAPEHPVDPFADRAELPRPQSNEPYVRAGLGTQGSELRVGLTHPMTRDLGLLNPYVEAGVRRGWAGALDPNFRTGMRFGADQRFGLGVRVSPEHGIDPVVEVGHGPLVIEADPFGADRSVSVGVRLPLGRKRPRDVRLASGGRAHHSVAAPLIQPSQLTLQRIPSTVRDALAGSAASVTRLTAPNLLAKGSEHPLAELRDPSIDAELVRFHGAVDDVFAVALGPGRSELARALAKRGEEILFDHVIVPFNGSYGYPRRFDNGGAPDLSSFVAVAAEAFAREIDHAKYAGSWSDREAERRGARDAFLLVAEQLTAAARESYRTWDNDNRLAWIPLKLGLRPADYDSEAEVSTLLSVLTGAPIARAQEVRYLMNDDWTRHAALSVLSTEHYHVAHIHDIRARDDEGRPDLDGWSFAHTYRRAFINAIMNQRAVLPEFSIYIDEHYPDANRSFPLFDYLQNRDNSNTLLGQAGFGEQSLFADLFDPRFDAQLATLFAGDAELRSIGIERFRAQRDRYVEQLHERYRREHGVGAGDWRSHPDFVRWLNQAFSVQVQITNQRNNRVARPTDDRDHAKQIFHDVFARYPGPPLRLDGSALSTAWRTGEPSGEGAAGGMGIGAHYRALTARGFTQNWKDSAILVRGGDAPLGLKAIVTQLHLEQVGADLPWYLRREPPPEVSEGSPVMITRNGTGFRQKQATVERMALYELAPAGSVLIAPDSLWLNEQWAGMLVAAARRGVQVAAVAPALEHAPSSAIPTMGMMHQTLAAMVQARQVLDLSNLRIGLYEFHGQTGIEQSNAQAVRDRVAAGLDHTVLSSMPGAEIFAQSLIEAVDALPPDARLGPALAGTPARLSDYHAKVQGLWTHLPALMQVPGERWKTALAAYFAARLEDTGGRGEPGVAPSVLDDLFAAWMARLSEEERRACMSFLTVGSMNQDWRSAIGDGEMLVTVSGRDTMMALLDLLFVHLGAIPVNDLPTLQQHLPKQPRVVEMIARMLNREWL